MIKELSADALNVLVIAYHPGERFYDIYENLAGSRQCNVLVYDNGGVNRLRLEQAGAIVLGGGHNDGIGCAINSGIDWAKNHSGTKLITFDQDSNVTVSTVIALAKYFDEAVISYGRVACIGPSFYDERSESADFPYVKIDRFFIRKIWPEDVPGEFVESDFIITSGMVINISCIADVGRFNEGFFIDYVDTEWCLRAVHCGYSVLGALKVRLPHSLSDKPASRVLGRLYLEYSDLRRYYQSRNSMLLLTMRHVPCSYKIYLMGTTFYRLFVWTIRSPAMFQTFKKCAQGVLDGVAGRVGKFGG